ncbi:hypothetical protein DL93DRAFT_1476979 [Clavulina sp. PMI_390]|nr:hypothetical protein DL93DRAFT_1476979 [Clavulina sp. PMI_390]
MWVERHSILSITERRKCSSPLRRGVKRHPKFGMCDISRVRRLGAVRPTSWHHQHYEYPLTLAAVHYPARNISASSTQVYAERRAVVESPRGFVRWSQISLRHACKEKDMSLVPPWSLVTSLDKLLPLNSSPKFPLFVNLLRTSFQASHSSARKQLEEIDGWPNSGFGEGLLAPLSLAAIPRTPTPRHIW